MDDTEVLEHSLPGLPPLVRSRHLLIVDRGTPKLVNRF